MTPSIRECLMTLDNHARAPLLAQELRDGAEVIAKHGGQAEELLQAAHALDGLHAVAKHMASWLKGGAMPNYQVPGKKAVKPPMPYLGKPSPPVVPTKAAHLVRPSTFASTDKKPIPDGCYGTEDVQKLLGWTRKKLDREIVEGRFPRGDRHGQRNVWPKHVVDAKALEIKAAMP